MNRKKLTTEATPTEWQVVDREGLESVFCSGGQRLPLPPACGEACR
jgi:hypothetical protein